MVRKPVELKRWLPNGKSSIDNTSILSLILVQRPGGGQPPNSDAVTDTPRPTFVGHLSILTAAIMWSTSGLFAKSPEFDAWPVEHRGLLLAFWRALFAGLIVLAFVRRPRFRWALLPMTMTFVVMNITYLCALTMTTAANAIWLQNTAPAWVFVFGMLLLREPVRRENVLLLTFGTLGVAVILVCEWQSEAAAIGKLGVVAGLLAGVSYAGVILFLRALRDENSAWLTAINLLATSAVLLPFVIWVNIWPNATQLALLCCFGIFQMGLPYVLFSRGLKQVSSVEASGIVLLEPILMPLWVWLVWRETPAWWTIAGGTLILVGLALRYGINWQQPVTVQGHDA